jgi:serine/threonine protein kinase
MEPAASVEALCNDLARSHLLPSEEVRAIHQRWRAEAGNQADDLDRFAKWLVANRHVTQFQATLLARGQTDRLFLGPYQLLDRIGKGRMAGVFKAVHPTGQTVAVKVLSPSRVKDPEALARFRREARLGLRLKHPNVVRTFQVGEADEQHYLVLEYLEGRTLDEILEEHGKLAPAEAVALVYQALLGLQYLYESGVVHRDLKPADLMVLPGPALDDLEQATVKIFDMGLCRALSDEGDEEEVAELTAEGVLVGDLDFAAPEQVQDSHSADVRSDIYSLGCVLYQALAGRPPFAYGDAGRKALRKAAKAAPPVRVLNPEVPDGLQQILDRMLAKDPARRYRTPQRAAQALEVFLVGRSEPAAPVPPQTAAYLHWLERQKAPDPGPGEEKIDVEMPVAPPKKKWPGGRLEINTREVVFLTVGIAIAVVTILATVLLFRGP